MRGILLAAVVIVCFMALIKDGRMLRRVGLTARCSAVVTVADGSIWEACKPGKLEGAPDLSRDGCARGATRGKIEYWHCPASIEAGHDA